MDGKDAFRKNIWKYQIYVTLCGLANIGPLCNLFYLSADISFRQLSFIEVTSLVVLTFFEVPSGALADIIGRKINIAIGCFLMGIELILIAVGFNYPVFILAAFIGGIGICLESGADDALLYDSLKRLMRENEFEKYLGQSSALFKVSSGIAGVLCSYLYSFDQNLIFYLSGGIFIFLAGFILTAKETLIKQQDKQIKSAFSKQLSSLMKRSFQQLIQNKNLVWMLIFTGILASVIRAHISIIRPSLLENILPNISYLGLVVGTGMIISSVISWNADKISKHLPENYVLIGFIVISSLAFIGMGLVEGVVSVGFIFMLTMLNAYKTIYLSSYWHRNFTDQERVTLSSIKQAFYSFLGMFILVGLGDVTDRFGMQSSSLILGFFILFVAFLMFAIKPKAKQVLIPINVNVNNTC